MNKEQQIEKDRLIQIEETDELIREKFHGQVAYRMDISKYGGFNGYTPLCTYDISKALYNAGYRKTFTSDLASDTQKAFKEGYEKAKEELLENGELVSKEWHDEQVLHAESEIKRLQSENKTLRLAKDDFKKRLNDSGHRNKKLSLKLGSLKKDIRKAQAKGVKEFAEKLKEIIHTRDYVVGYAELGLCEEIDELLKEYEK